MSVIRWLLGRMILLLNFMFTPKKPKRDAELQAKLDAQTQSLALYQYAACPFCVKVRRAMHRQGLNIATIDAKQTEHKLLLQQGGGKLQVPCLRIEEQGKVSWLYESSAIIRYLNDKFPLEELSKKAA